MIILWLWQVLGKLVVFLMAVTHFEVKLEALMLKNTDFDSLATALAWSNTNTSSDVII